MKTSIQKLGYVVWAGVLLAVLSHLADAENPPLWGELCPGPHAVGFKSTWGRDYSRRYNTTFDDKTTYASDKAPRPVLVNIWYPTSEEKRSLPH